ATLSLSLSLSLLFGRGAAADRRGFGAPGGVADGVARACGDAGGLLQPVGEARAGAVALAADRECALEFGERLDERDAAAGGQIERQLATGVRRAVVPRTDPSLGDRERAAVVGERRVEVAASA